MPKTRFRLGRQSGLSDVCTSRGEAVSENAETRTPHDGELLFRLSRGDEPAYRMLHDRHQAPVWRMSLVLMRTTWDAEEVAATAFFELWRKRDKVRVVDGSVLPWLLATTSFAAKNSLRSRRRYQRLLARIPRDADVPDHADEVAQAMDSLRISSDVREALLHLNQRDASVVILCVIRTTYLGGSGRARHTRGDGQVPVVAREDPPAGSASWYAPTTEEANA